MVIVARFVWVFPAIYLPRWLSPSLARRDPSPPWQWAFLLAFVGMRGVVSLAAALAIPLTTATGAAVPRPRSDSLHHLRRYHRDAGRPGTVVADRRPLARARSTMPRTSASASTRPSWPHAGRRWTWRNAASISSRPMATFRPRCWRRCGSLTIIGSGGCRAICPTGSTPPL